MKILFVFNHPAPYKMRFFNLLGKKCDLSVLFERTKNRDRNKLFYSESVQSFRDIAISGIPFGKENHLSWQIKKHLKTNKYDLIIMNGYSTISEMIAIRYLQKHKIPYAFYINGGLIKKESYFKYRFKKSFINGASCYFSPSPIADEYLNYYGVDAQPIYHYPYSSIYHSEISPFLSKTDKQELRTSLGLPYPYLYFSVGQFIKRKGFTELLDFWCEMPNNNHLVLIGEGPEKKKYESIIQKNHLKNVTILSFKKRETLLQYLRSGDGFIFFSHEDIYGHVINEALSQGLPVISTPEVVAARHLINDGDNGFIIDRTDYDDIMKSIKYIQNHDLRNNAIRVAEENTLEKMVDAHLEIFKEVIGK